MILYWQRLQDAKSTDEEYVCIEIYEDGSVLKNDWPRKWLRAYRLNLSIFVFLTLFQIAGVLGGLHLHLRLVAWCTICIAQPIHVIVLVYTTVVRFNLEGRSCALNVNLGSE